MSGCLFAVVWTVRGVQHFGHSFGGRITRILGQANSGLMQHTDSPCASVVVSAFVQCASTGGLMCSMSVDASACATDLGTGMYVCVCVCGCIAWCVSCAEKRRRLPAAVAVFGVCFCGLWLWRWCVKPAYVCVLGCWWLVLAGALVSLQDLFCDWEHSTAPARFSSAAVLACAWWHAGLYTSTDPPRGP